MCSSMKTSQDNTWLAREWPVLYPRFSLEDHLTELLISKTLKTFTFHSSLKRTVQQCFCSCSVWPHLQSLIHSLIHLTIYHTRVLLSHGPHVSKEETTNQPNSMVWDQCYDRKGNKMLFVHKGWGSNLNEGYEWGQESGKRSKRV